MEADDVGQMCPVVDESRCVDCSLCEKVCCENNEVGKSNTIYKLFLNVVHLENLAIIVNSLSQCV